MQKNKIPEWDLTDLYNSPNSEKIKVDFQRAEKLSKKFSNRYKGIIKDIDGDKLGQAISEFEIISEILYKILSYGQLLHTADITNEELGRFFQTVHEKVTEISSHTLFFKLEIN